MRRPVWILYVFVVGLALHNLAMAELYAAGIRGAALDAVSAWKDALLALGLVLVLRARGSLRFSPAPLDWLALAYGAFVVVYALIPQHLLGGLATHRGVLLGAREDLLPAAAYFFGRGLDLGVRDLRRLGATIIATAAAVAAFGLVDVYAIPLQWWRHSGAPGWFWHQLGFDYGKGLSHLPQNFVYNTGGGHPFRRLVSTFLSPLAASYTLVVALLLAAAWRLRLRPRPLLWVPTVVLLFAGLLWTHSRSSYLALALGLLVLAALRPGERVPLAAAAVAVIALGLAFVELYPRIGPATSFTAQELAFQERNAHRPGAGPAVGPGGLTDASTSSHLASLRAGISAVFHHPQGYGPGNAGSTAARTNVTVETGESTYTQIAADTGLVGGLVFVAWSLALLLRLAGGSAWLAASFAAVLALGLQTDVLGAPWLVCVLWPLAGWCVSRPPVGVAPTGAGRMGAWRSIRVSRSDASI